MHDSVDLPAKGRRKRAQATDADADAESSAKEAARRNEGEATIAWYLRTIGNHELLTSDEELELATLVQRTLAVRAKGTQMEEDLGRPATQSELAAALSLGTPPPPLPPPPPPPPPLSSADAASLRRPLSEYRSPASKAPAQACCSPYPKPGPRLAPSARPSAHAAPHSNDACRAEQVRRS